LGEGPDPGGHNTTGTGGVASDPAALAKAQTPPLEFRSEEIGQVRPLGDDKNYGEAVVSISLNCAIEQLVNLLADITAQPEAIATGDPAHGGNQKEKTLSVRLTVAGMVLRTRAGEERTGFVLTRRLQALNLALLVLFALVAIASGSAGQAHTRARLVLGKPLESVAPIPEAPLKQPEPVKAADYIDVAQQLLFARDRIPRSLELEAPKPVPEMPVVHGVLDIGSGPTAIMSEASGRLSAAIVLESASANSRW
jgi:hypothetical protein